MNRDVLTVLGCSSSIALMLLTVSPAYASTVTPQDGNAEAPSTITIETVGTTLGQWVAESPSLDLASDRIGDLSILKLGCDCAGCRTQVSKMMQQGSF